MRGLRNKLKRKAIFKYFKDKNLDIVLMQEVHCNNKNVKIWESEWGSKWHCSSGTSNSRGTAIAFNPRENKIKITEQFCDHEGRNVLCNIQIENSEFSICNVYAPNDDNPKFFESIFKTLSKHAKENIIIGGDFNTTLNVTQDRLNSSHNNY